MIGVLSRRAWNRSLTLMQFNLNGRGRLGCCRGDLGCGTLVACRCRRRDWLVRSSSSWPVFRLSGEEIVQLQALSALVADDAAGAAFIEGAAGARRHCTAASRRTHPSSGRRSGWCCGETIARHLSSSGAVSRYLAAPTGKPGGAESEARAGSKYAGHRDAQRGRRSCWGTCWLVACPIAGCRRTAATVGPGAACSSVSRCPRLLRPAVSRRSCQCRRRRCPRARRSMRDDPTWRRGTPALFRVSAQSTFHPDRLE